MKLHRLVLEGFGPFRDLQSVDFDAFDADGLFLISGRTGAGKSSILDGVCYALYGTAPRYDGSDRGLRSDHANPADPTRATLEFSAGGGRWRITRTPEYDRPKARGEGVTTQRSTVLLERLVEGEWRGVTTKYREAADELQQIVGLTRDQFQQVILLAQNRFAEFLLAGNDDRQALLRTLFGSRRYEEYEKAFDARRREAQQELAADSAALDAQLAHAESLIAGAGLEPTAVEPAAADAGAGSEGPRTAETRLAELVRAVPRADYRAESSARERDEAEKAHDAALAAFGMRSDVRSRQQERALSREALAAREADEPQIAADRVTLERARSAELLRDVIDAARRAAGAAVAATADLVAAQAAWIAGGDGEAEAAALRRIADGIAGELAVWTLAAQRERELPQATAEIARLDERIATVEQRIVAADHAGAARRARIAEIEPLREQLQSTAPAVASAQEALAVARRRREAGRDAEALLARVTEADARHLADVAALEKATAAVRDLLARRLGGYAAELAAGLVDGEPCPVCGAAEHPQPAPPAHDPVTEEAIDAADAAVVAAGRAVETAAAEARSARAAHAAAAARAGGEPLPRLEDACAEAEGAVVEAEAAAARLAALSAELELVRTAEAAAADERDALVREAGEARERRAAAAASLDEGRALVDEARGDHGSVTARITDAERRRDRARAYADAADAQRRADERAAQAAVDLDARLQGTDFAAPEDAVAALVDTAGREALAARIQAHEITLQTVKNRLLDLETGLAGEPDELIDLEPFRAAASASKDVWNATLERAARDAEVALQLRDAVSRAVELHAAAAVRLDAYDVIAGLADAVAGRTAQRMDLETFVLAAELEQIVDAANLRLDTMSAGRYRLRHTDAVARHRSASGLGLEVMDAYTGQARAPRSLSGGETFLASLALALGLAEVVTARAGGVRLDTLFIDEGFGSLDPETLDLAMRTLDELRQGGRTVGLISHVEAMKEQVPAQLLVEATPQGPSIIRQDAAVLA